MDRHNTCQAGALTAAPLLIIGFMEKIVYTASVGFRTSEALRHSTTIKVAVIWSHKSSI